MRVTIKGLTDSTITFNTIGIIVRGNSSKPDAYPNSVAKHIDIKNDEQMRELITLKNANLISFVDEDEEQKISISTQNIATKPVVITSKTKLIQPKQPTVSKLSAPPIVEDSNIISLEEVEDMPLPQPEENEEELLTIGAVNPKKKKSHRKTGKPVGRPKKNPETEKIAKTSKVKPIKRSKNFGTPNVQKEDEKDSKIVVMTPGGPVQGNAVNNMAGDLPESEATRASIKALKKIEEEEAIPEKPVDESKLDVSQRMGEAAVIATGDNVTKKVAMKNSLVPEAEAIKNRGIKFINPNGDDSDEVDHNLDESIKDIFIDNNDNNDDNDDNFIET